jgi:hypothetical protein
MSSEIPTFLLATTLLELSLFLAQGRAVFPYHRIRSFPSNDELSKRVLFESLPVADYSEEQAFFVLTLNSIHLEPSGSVLLPVCEIRLRDVLSLHPVTESAKEIFNSSQRLPGVVLADARFESAWHSFASNRYAAQTLGIAIDFVDEIVPCSMQDLASIAGDFKAGIVAKHLGLEEVIQTPFSRFIYQLLNYKRETDKYYDSEQLKVIFIDLFKIIVASGTPDDLCDLGREFVKSQLLKKDLTIDQDGLIALFIDKEYQSIIQQIAEYFSCSVSWFQAAIIYLCIRLDKQNGKARNLVQYVDAIRSRSAFDLESTRLGLLLIALPESQSTLNEFVNATKQSELGIFNSSPAKPSGKVRIFEASYFEEVEALREAKTAESELKNEPVPEIPVTVEVAGATDEDLVVPSGNEIQGAPSNSQENDGALEAGESADSLNTSEAPGEDAASDGLSESNQNHNDVHASAITSAVSLSSSESSSS